MKTIILLIMAFFLTTANSCQKNDLTPDGDKFIDLDEKSAQLVEADNTFGLKIFQKIREESDKENIMISPLSISVALAMAYNGADGDTKNEMRETMELNGLSTEEINASYKMLIKALQSLDKDVVFQIANSIFYADEFTVKSPFLSINEDIYNAEVQKLNFSLPSSVNIINDWVSDKTNQKIQKIIETLNPLDRMVLLNAIYFNGIWTNKFDEKGTYNLNFVKSNGTSLEVPMMNKLDKVPYMSGNLFKAIKIPYGNDQYNMVVILPAGGNNSQYVIDNLNSDSWKSWMESFEMTDRVDITMPRFKFAFEADLNNVLKSMGMRKVFIPDVADFSGITDIDLYISMIKHKSYIDVNENGTEAAAITGIVFETTSIGDEPPTIPFYVNRPFVFAITEKDTDAILFIGEVNHPEYN
ncbi:MAG: serpin family protein [Prolixibacteraceae bacterium]|nr:serpin family protein [Prolixibacteraceae bacterium]